MYFKIWPGSIRSTAMLQTTLLIIEMKYAVPLWGRVSVPEKKMETFSKSVTLESRFNKDLELKSWISKIVSEGVYPGTALGLDQRVKDLVYLIWSDGGIPQDIETLSVLLARDVGG